MSTFEEIRPEFEISSKVKSVDIHALTGSRGGVGGQGRKVRALPDLLPLQNPRPSTLTRTSS